MPKFEEIHLGEESQTINQPLLVDAKGTQCPGPIMALKSAFKKAVKGQHVKIEVTDPGFRSDVVAWCHVTQNQLLSLSEESGVITAEIVKSTEIGEAEVPQKEDSLTIVMFSDEMDRGLAAFNIALGALAMGMKVQIFFTFWGLSLIKKHQEEGHKSTLKEMLVDHVLPHDDQSLPLSHKNMLGIGRKMMERLMKEKNVSSLDFMIHLAKYDGIKFIACQMSMELMNLSKDDFIEGVEVGGVATMVEYARKSNLNYFV